MATLSSVTRHSHGNQTKVVARFSAIDTDDTWASGLGTGIQDWYFNRTDAPTTYTGATVTQSAGTFTFLFYAGVEEGSVAGDLVIFGNF
jgi:hypothetical protein